MNYPFVLTVQREGTSDLIALIHLPGAGLVLVLLPTNRLFSRFWSVVAVKLGHDAHLSASSHMFTCSMPTKHRAA
ncbi:hypothetical protein EVAR_70773_1 [Eumeta japonica]|uniref:Uncharacterized protein n=1 Tax=Eumeta variegata TaxID=151549 RepID=A0A4C1SY11_EUMVA|nr:hypothetical protein EVAR_70773_1 [Eumeta japonica]